VAFQSRLILTAIASALLFSGDVLADEWPQFLGPNRDGSTRESLGLPWPAEGLEKLWTHPVGAGFSGPAVSGTNGVVFHREADKEILESWDPATGRTLWRHASPTAYSDDFGFDEGPRAVPSISDGRVFAFGAEGRLICVRLSDGGLEWEIDTRSALGMRKGFFGAACSPLIAKGLVLVNIGGKPGAGVAAFDVRSGRLAWSATDDEAGYAAPVPGPAAGEACLFFTRAGLRSVRLSDGTLTASFPWRSRMNASVNAASPLVRGDEVFVTASYGTGAALLKCDGSGFHTVWTGDDSLSCHYATPVVFDGRLYGFHGRQENRPDFRCVEWSTGKVLWTAESLGAGTVVLAGGDLAVLLESGELIGARASREKFEPASRFQASGSGTRAPFAVAGGRLFVRDTRKLSAFRLPAR
jgi:outer membrane protein assembly factor BamB